MTKVLISGGSGLLGSEITERLLSKGIEVAHLSTRKSYTREGVDVYFWNPAEQKIDEAAFEGVDVVVHLAGAGIADKAWTTARKKEIIDSRVESSKLLMDYINNSQHHIQHFIGASAIGFYGSKGGVLTEEMKPGDDFLAEVCQLWEGSYAITNPSVRKTILRIGIVLAEEGGALPEMTKTLPFFVGVLGSGDQVYSWIHLNDLAEMFLFAIESNSISGTFNAVAPNPRTQKEIAKTIAKLRSTISLPAPKFGLKLVLGEMSSVLFLSQDCSAQKIQDAGFDFSFEKLEDALDDLM